LDSATSLTYFITGGVDILLPVSAAVYFAVKYKVEATRIMHAAVLYLVSLVFVVIGVGIHNRLLSAIDLTLLLSLTMSFTTASIEEVIRYLSLKYVAPDIRSRGMGLAFGAGWAAMPTILIGLTLLLTPMSTYMVLSAMKMANETNSTESVTAIIENLKEPGIKDAITSFIPVTSIFLMQILWMLIAVSAIRDNKLGRFRYVIASHWAANWGMIYLTRLDWAAPTLFFTIAAAITLHQLMKFKD